MHDADSALDESEVDNANDVDDTNGAGDAVGANGADVGYDANTFNSVWTMIGLKMELVGEQTNVDNEWWEGGEEWCVLFDNEKVEHSFKWWKLVRMKIESICGGGKNPQMWRWKEELTNEKWEGEGKIDVWVFSLTH